LITIFSRTQGATWQQPPVQIPHAWTPSSVALAAVLLSCEHHYTCFSVSDSWIVKIADFGMSRDVYEKDYYHEANSKEKPKPLKWMAIESFREGKYSTASDVVCYSCSAVQCSTVQRSAVSCTQQFIRLITY